MLSYHLGFSHFTGPRGKTLAAFWHMVWQENVHVIVMATGLFENAAVSICIIVIVLGFFGHNSCVELKVRTFFSGLVCVLGQVR